MKVLFIAGIMLWSVSCAAQQFNFTNEGQRVIEEPAQVDVTVPERFAWHAEATYIYQYKPEFSATYGGLNSLRSKSEEQSTLTATLYAGLRLWKGAAVFVNAEAAGGNNLSGSMGMAGASNGDGMRVTGASPSGYIARAYLRQTFALRNTWARRNGTLNMVEQYSSPNRLAGYEPKNYLRLYAGKLALNDMFDNNTYTSAPRRYFMNRALMNNGAWDFAADIRGYTYAFVAELCLGPMNYKAAMAAIPELPNGMTLNTHPAKGYALNGEISRQVKIGGKAGSIRLLGYLNNTPSGYYNTAIKSAQLTGYTPNVFTGTANSYKYGFGLNYEQNLSEVLGLFARVGWNNGETAAWSFSDIDQTISLGLNANGAKWQRVGDNCGIAFVANGLSSTHSNYLALGGRDITIGDGALNYAPEMIAELFYSLKLSKSKSMWLSGDYQYCLNPAYNADRGPVHIISARLHVAL